ncbi:unnamed protein product [Parnassius mnemosyne]|uniref:CCHC-type domain-containing protein n=1 Tax=Parnassius mnemosyne TaxID=213953 RepID=A0AAV1M4T4_9NEOP
MEEEDTGGTERQLIEDELARKQAELEELEQMRREAGFTPRSSLRRTPPQGFSTPPVPYSIPAAASTSMAKRPLTSPEDVQETVRRRVAEKRSAIPPVSGILSRPISDPSSGSDNPTPSTSTDSSSGISTLDKVALMEKVHAALKGIATVANASNKLNLADKTTIGSLSQDILAYVATLEIRLGEKEQEVTACKLKCAQLELSVAQTQTLSAPPFPYAASSVPSADSYAARLKLPKGKPPLCVQSKGPAVIVYPNNDSIKSSDDTKTELQKAVQPGTQGIKIHSVRKVGNSGIVVQTATIEAAQKLKAAVPPSLKVSDPKSRRPLVAVRNLRSDPPATEFIEDLYRINLSDDPDWPRDKFGESCRVAFKKGRKDVPRTTVVMECTSALRDKLVGLGSVFIGWDEAEVCDYVRVTCCTKCQQYGHPEKHCRAAAMVCGKCGETGHRAAECQSATQCCATCKRFKRKDADQHATAALNCPARLHAEQQSVNMTQYG